MARHRMGLDQASVVEAAIKLVDEEGWEQLSLGHLARRLGVQTPSLYNHIEGLADLKQRMALYCMRDLLNILLHVTVGKARKEAVYALADAYRAYAKNAPARYSLTQRAPDPDERETLAAAEQLVEVVGAILAPYFQSPQTTQESSTTDNISSASAQAETHYGPNDQNAIFAIRGLRSIVQGFISLEMAHGFKMPVDLDASFHWLLDIFLAGINRSSAVNEENAALDEP